MIVSILEHLVTWLGESTRYDPERVIAIILPEVLPVVAGSACVPSCCRMLGNRLINVANVKEVLVNTTPEDTTTPTIPIYLSIEALAEVLRIHPKTIARLARTGVLPTLHIGRSVRFRLDEVDKAMALAPMSSPTR